MENYSIQVRFTDHEGPVPSGTLVKYAGPNVASATKVFGRERSADYGRGQGDPTRRTEWVTSGEYTDDV